MYEFHTPTRALAKSKKIFVWLGYIETKFDEGARIKHLNDMISIEENLNIFGGEINKLVVHH